MTGGKITNGCNECSSGVSIQVNATFNKFSTQVCVISEFVENNYEDEVTDYPYEDFCKKHGLNNTCKECMTDYLLNSAGKCFETTANCEEAKANKTCETCEDGYYESNADKCILIDKANCTEASSTGVCTECADGYYLTKTGTKECKEGQIDQCKDYNEGGTLCDICNTDYLLVEGRQKCIPDSIIDHCVTYTSPVDIDGVECTGCETYYLKTDVDVDTDDENSIGINAVTRCRDMNSISNCVDHTSGLICEECDTSSHYLENGGTICIARTAINNCKTYDDNEDKCDECNTNYFLAEDDKECHAYPTGINGCSTYSSDTICIGCTSGKYLKIAEDGSTLCLDGTS